MLLLLCKLFSDESRISSCASVQDLFDAPAAEQEVEALFKRLDDTVGNVASKQVLAPTEAEHSISQVLPQRGGHGLGQGALRVHLEEAEERPEEVGEGSTGTYSLLRGDVLKRYLLFREKGLIEP